MVLIDFATQSDTTLVLSIMLGSLLRYWIQMPIEQPHKQHLNIYQIAYLVGGESRAVGLAIVQLVKQGYLLPNVRNHTFSIKKLLPAGANQLEQHVMLQVRKAPDLNTLQRINKSQIHFSHEQLEDKQLLMTEWRSLIGSSFSLLVIITILGLVIENWLGIKIGQFFYSSRFLTWIWFVIWIVSICCFVPSGRTYWGHKILTYLKKNPGVYDVSQRFAIYGYKVLSGEALDDLRQIYQEQEETSF